MLLVCFNFLYSQNIYLSINSSEKRLVPRTPLKLHRKKSNNWPMVSFIHNGSEITTWMHKSTKSKATFLSKINSFFNFKLQIIRLVQGYWSCKPTHQNSYFYSYNYEKTNLAVHVTFHSRCVFFVFQFVDRKVMGLVPKYHLPVEDTSQVSIFFLTEDKNE